MLHKLTGKLTAMLIAVCLALPLMPVTALAEEGCNHQHDTECGYIEDVADCGHIHDENCGDRSPTGVVLTALDELEDEILWQGFDFGEIADQDEIVLPDTLTGEDGNGDPVTLSGVAWKSAPGFDPGVSAWYYFSPGLPQGYALAQGVATPVISVFIRPDGGAQPQPMAAAGTMDIGGENISLSADNGDLSTKGWSWVAANKILTLNSNYTKQPIDINCLATETIKLVYSGNVTVTNSGNGIGIACNGSLDVTGGGGALTVKAGNAAGIASAANFTISGGTLMIKVGYHYGIMADGNVTISDSVVTIDSSGAGISAMINGNVTISDSIVTIDAVKGGINAGGNITISGGSGTIKTGGSELSSVAAIGSLNVNGVSVMGWDGSAYTVVSDTASHDFSSVLPGNQITNLRTFVKRGTNDPLFNIQFMPPVTFTAQGGVNFRNPTDLVFTANNAALLNTYSFVSVRLINPSGKGYTLYPEGSTHPDAITGLKYDSATGKLTIPAAVFGLHSGPQLPAGTYTAVITFGDDQDTPAFTFEYACPFTMTYTFDAGSDALFTFNGNYADLDKIYLNGEELTQTPNSQMPRMDLSGYRGYRGVLGHAESGSVKVTLYRAFLATLPSGTYTLTVNFRNGPSGNLPFVIQQPNSGSRSSVGSKNDTPAVTWLERDPAALLARNAKTRGEDYVRTRTIGVYGVRGNAWDRLSGLRYEHDTMDDGAIQVRLRIKNPEKITKDTRVSGYVKGVNVDIRKASFEKWVENKLRVIHFDHQGAWGQSVDVAAKVDLTGMDTKNLYFYAYDKAVNSYRRIEEPAYWIDKNGYLHFTTVLAGDIIISEGRLARKG